MSWHGTVEIKLDISPGRMRTTARNGARFWREEDLLHALNLARQQNKHEPIAVAAFDVFRDLIIEAGIRASHGEEAT